jgi:hypothetical protein
MQAQVEFSSYVKNGAIAIPDDYISAVPSEVYVIVKPICEQKKYVKKHPQAGCMKGVFTYMSDDFNEPLEDFKEYM